jgi:CubicO group peptidase (beta-lactamase class C family)
MNLAGYDLKLAEALRAELDAARKPEGAGTSAAVVIGGRLAASCATGVCGDGVTPVTTGDLFNIGSISKVYCAAALRRLERQGKLRLDDPVRKYLPWFKTRDPRDERVTLRMLLNHSSGLPGTNSRNMIDPGKGALDRRASNRKYWSRAKLKAAPGEYSTYCNEGFELAAEVVETVSGMTYEDFLREEIFLPMGLKSNRLALSLSGREHPVYMRGQAEEIIVAKGAGAVSCTMEDNAMFGYAFIHPGFFSEEEIADMTEPTGRTFLKKDEMSPTFGLGWDGVEITEFGMDLGVRAYRKGGATLQFTSYLVVIPRFDMSISLSATYDCGFLAGSEIFRLIRIVAERCGFDLGVSAAKTAVPGACPDPAAALSGYCGIYRSSGTLYRLSIDGAELVCETDNGPGWKTAYRLPLVLFDGEYINAGGERFCFEEHGGKTYLLVSDYHLGVPVYPTAQRGDSFGELPKAWKDRLGKSYIAADLTLRDIELDGPYIARIADGGDGVLNFPVLGTIGGMLSVKPCGDDDTEMFVNGPGYGSMNQWAPYFLKDGGREILSIFDYDFIDADGLSELTKDMVRVSPGKNAVYKLSGPAKLDCSLPEGVCAVAISSEAKINACVKAGEEDKVLDGAFLLFLCDDRETEFEAKLERVPAEK